VHLAHLLLYVPNEMVGRQEVIVAICLYSHWYSPLDLGEYRATLMFIPHHLLRLEVSEEL